MEDIENNFLNLGFVDESFLEDVPNAVTREKVNAEEPTEKQTEEVEKIEENSKTNEQQEETKVDKQEEKETSSSTESKGSPNLSSSIAEALVEEGGLQTLDAERIAKITDAKSLIEAQMEEIDNRVDSKLTEIQKRVNNALNYGLQPTEIQQYEQWIDTLNKVTDKILKGEGEQNENYRKNLIYNNYIVKGFDEEEALDMTNRSVESGNDMADAEKALSSLKKYYQTAYENKVAEAKKQYDSQMKKQKEQFDKLKESILNDDAFYEPFEVSKSIRQKIFDTVAKPSIKDGEDMLTPIQKYIKDDPNRANRIIGTLYVLTDGFTKFDGIMKGTVKKQVRKGMSNLEKALTQSDVKDGSLNFMSGIGEATDDFKILDFAI